MTKQHLTLDNFRNTPAGRRPDNAHLFKQKKKASKRELYQTGQIITKVYNQSSKEKQAIEEALFEFSQNLGFVLYAEYHFHPERRWRFDWCIPDLMLAVEFEGIMSDKSRHTTIGGYSGDTDKYREAAILGWRVLRYTVLNYTELGNDLKNIKR